MYVNRLQLADYDGPIMLAQCDILPDYEIADSPPDYKRTGHETNREHMGDAKLTHFPHLILSVSFPEVLVRIVGLLFNRRYLRQGDHHYIIGEKMRSGSEEVKAAMWRQGRYLDVADNMPVKEVRISESERFVICFNPEAADRYAAGSPAAGPGPVPAGHPGRETQPRRDESEGRSQLRRQVPAALQ